MTDVRHRRGTHVDETVLSATLELLISRGYDFTIEDVAVKSDVHKTTIYRRWDSKPTLVAAAITLLSEQTVVAGETKDPIADLVNLALQVAKALTGSSGRNPLRATLAAAGSDPELGSIAREFFRSRYAVAVPLVRRAQEAGLIRPDVDPVLLWQAIVNPMHLDAICGNDTTSKRARELTDLVLQGAQPRVGQRA